jgi:pyruvate kinase
MRRTKIVATIGPASETPERLAELAEAGLDVARLNFSHGTHAWHGERIRLIRELERQRGRPLAILQDLCGPKVRVGELPPEGLEIKPGSACVLTAASRLERIEEPVRIPVPVPALLAALKPGDQLFLDDGLMEIVVEDRLGDEVRCVVVTGGRLRSRKGVTARRVAFPMGAFTKRDRSDLQFGIQQGVDWVAVSYVRKKQDVAVVRAMIADAGATIPIIAKIEKWEAVNRLDELLEVSDALMVARGDLGVELPLHEVPVIQKEIVRRANAAGKPVITATQMLESMVQNPRPTRAEVSDVANAILDGSDAVMLSGETAAGAHPVAAVQVMDQVARHTEGAFDFAAWLAAALARGARSIPDAISEGACHIAGDLGATAIIASTTSGATARLISRNRPKAPILGATAREETWRRLALSWGVYPLLCAPTTSTDAMLAEATARAKAAGLVKEGDVVVICSGMSHGVPGSTNLIKVQRLEP